MSNKYTVFYRGNQAVLADFSAGDISSDGAVVIMEILERKHKLIKYFSKHLSDKRHPSYTKHSVEKMLKQRVFMLMSGYEDTNDVEHLKKDPLYQDVLAGQLVSQPTLSRFENSVDKHAVFALCNSWLDRYVGSLEGRRSIIIDVDATDDPTHGSQQLSMFNGFYGQFMYNELFFHDGNTGQIILPVLRPGNSHSNKWYVSILKRIIKRIRAAYPKMEIIVRGDSGFSCAPFYRLADQFKLKYTLGIASNAVLKKLVTRSKKAVEYLYASQGIKHKHFIGFEYKAESWHKSQRVYAKV